MWRASRNCNTPLGSAGGSEFLTAGSSTSSGISANLPLLSLFASDAQSDCHLCPILQCQDKPKKTKSFFFFFWKIASALWHFDTEEGRVGLVADPSPTPGPPSPRWSRLCAHLVIALFLAAFTAGLIIVVRARLDGLRASFYSIVDEIHPCQFCSPCAYVRNVRTPFLPHSVTPISFGFYVDARGVGVGCRTVEQSPVFQHDTHTRSYWFFVLPFSNRSPDPFFVRVIDGRGELEGRRVANVSRQWNGIRTLIALSRRGIRLR